MDLTSPPDYMRDASIRIFINVLPVNDAPVAVNDGPYTIEAGQPLITSTGGGGGGPGVLLNDSDVEGNPLSAVLESGPAHGTLTLNANGSFMYTAEETFSGTDTFTYRASDGLLTSNLATVTINVIPRNLPPVSAPDAYSVDEDASLSVAAPSVLGNDTDPEGLPLTISLVVGQAHGTLTIFGDGGFSYTPHANYHGPDEFWYRAFDGVNFGEPTRVTLTVNSINDLPVAAPESYELDEDIPKCPQWPGFWPTTPISMRGTTLRSERSKSRALTLNINGGFTTPARLLWRDSFSYRPDAAGCETCDSDADRAANERGACRARRIVFRHRRNPLSVVVAGSTSLNMVSDPGDWIGQGLTYNFTPATGTFTVSRNYDNGVTIRYTAPGQDWWLDFAAPNEGLLLPGLYSNAMRFPFQAPGRPGMDISGNHRGSNQLTGWFNISEVAYGPTGEVLVFSATFEQHSENMGPALRGTIQYNAGATTIGGVLLNDSDFEGSPLTAVLVQGPANGQVILNPNGTFMYLPNVNFAGVDTFRYRVSDGTSLSNIATATITVAGVNDAPVNVVQGTQTLVEDTTVTFSTANGNAIRLTDIDAGSSVVELRLSLNGFMTFPTTTGLTFVSGINGGNLITVRGTLADLNAALDGLVARPGANFTGNYNLQVRTNDLGNSGSGSALIDTDNITLSITPVNDAPQNVVPPHYTRNERGHTTPSARWIWITDADQTTGNYYAPVRHGRVRDRHRHSDCS